MKILLFGEYNRTHRNIKLGLEALGHIAQVASTTDGFKKVAVDIEFKDYFTSFYPKKIRSAIFRFFNFDISAFVIKRQIKRQQKVLSGFDCIQLVNEAPFDFHRKHQKEIYKLLIQWNPNAKWFLLSCGLDYPSVQYAYQKKFEYSILTPYFEGKGQKKDFSPALSYLTPQHIELHHFLYNKIKGVIANDLDYHIPLKHHPRYLGMIPHAIHLESLKFSCPKVDDKIVIFHGINTANYIKKGNDIFEVALALIPDSYKTKIEIITLKNIPYKIYIEAFDSAHILLDQVYAYDQGFNALEAMAKGKVVFTGAEKEWETYFNIAPDTVAINALPNAQNIASKLVWLIENPNKIISIAKAARRFVECFHDHENCAKAYLKFYKSNQKTTNL